MGTNASVASLSVAADHEFSKRRVEIVTFVAGVGVEGDAHSGVTVQHRSRQSKEADSPNLRQVHLLDAALLARLGADGFEIEPGALGENVTLNGVDTSAMSVGTIIELGDNVVLAVTGRRNPCGQVKQLSSGLQERLTSGRDGRVEGGAMAVVVHGGRVAVGDDVVVTEPRRHRPLQRV